MLCKSFSANYISFSCTHFVRSHLPLWLTLCFLSFSQCLPPSIQCLIIIKYHIDRVTLLIFVTFFENNDYFLFKLREIIKELLGQVPWLLLDWSRRKINLRKYGSVWYIFDLLTFSKNFFFNSIYFSEYVCKFSGQSNFFFWEK